MLYIVYGLDGSWFDLRQRQEIFPSPQAPKPAIGPLRYWDSVPRIERPLLEFDYSPPRSTDIKNEWSYTSTPLYMRSWRGWELGLCLSLCFNLVLHRGTAVVGCSRNMTRISIQSVAPQSHQNTSITALFPRTKGTC